MKIIRIESCEECPNISTEWDFKAGESIWVCDYNNASTDKVLEIDNPETIHPDCPLPDDEVKND